MIPYWCEVFNVGVVFLAVGVVLVYVAIVPNLFR